MFLPRLSFLTSAAGLVYRACTAVLAGLATLLLLFLPVDAYEFGQDPSQHILGLHLDTTAPDWQWQYLRSNLQAWLIALSFLLLLGAARHWPHRPWLRYACRVAVALALAKLVTGCSEWAATGFDH